MANRKKLSDLKVDLSDVHDIQMTDCPDRNYIVFRNEKGDILFFVSPEYLFDGNGNRFEHDL